MKKLFLLLLCSIDFFSLAQKIELKVVNDSSQIFKGEVAGIPVTMQLHYRGIVDCSQYQHFIDGWYFYDKYQKKIPLTGIYDYGNLYLYNFGNKQKQSSKILGEKITSPQWIEKTDSIAKTLNPKESFIFKNDRSNKEVQGKFILGNKAQSASLFTKNNMIYRFNNYLILPNNKKINTYDFIDSYGGNELVSYVSDQSGNRILLYFEHTSNFNACGMCGASEGEKGYRVLYFTSDWNYKKHEDFLTESCINNIYDTVVTKTKDSKVLKFAIKKTTTSPAYTLVVDRNNASVTKSK
ncbi:hypothetical protein ACNFU2_15070 [Chryseobacterium sp. PTM-20240506]|uniref:hypothetical protein n=1 Tax=unclassified Chryseobacterium TaxID=2593645 RepID=UPI0023599480|nr:MULTISPECIES: hypothetical protein [unclassified Chryseobacterium]MDC8106209.1 hypothetical protein [Chryseobacterium sp. B21-037]MDQ1804714.1 hypothetical protein [Chryseobacterium sp. CKR4-1]